jgi:23S rRNA-/tRNA-specific pseudouridylate synthase
VGDTLYGFATPRLPLKRQFLHAHRLRLRLPATGEEREFVAPLPPELEETLKALKHDSLD